MHTLNPVSTPRQQDSQPAPKKVGFEVVRSADLSSRFFRGPRPGGKPILAQDDDDWTGRIANVLRGKNAA
jgi:hypothetical protein